MSRRILEALRRFDEVFAILEDRDAEIARGALQWAQEEGRSDQAAPELVAAYSLSDQQIDALLAEREQARRTRNFARSRRHPQRAGGVGNLDRGLQRRRAVEKEIGGGNVCSVGQGKKARPQG